MVRKGRVVLNDEEDDVVGEELREVLKVKKVVVVVVEVEEAIGQWGQQ